MQFSEERNLVRGNPTIGDPFNFPMPGKLDSMNLSTILTSKDNMKTSTVKFQTRRSESTNLSTSDIEGKL